MSDTAGLGGQVRRVDFWESRYHGGRTAWDLGGPTPRFVRLLETDPPPPGRMAVPGCGRGHDVVFFARHGFEVVGFDFAPSAVAAGTSAAAREGVDGRARFERADIFGLPDRYSGAFDYVLERACFCAIDPADRDRYVRAMHAILKPGGRLIGSFLVGDRQGGPPFATTSSELRRRFEPHFAFERSDPPLGEGVLPSGDGLFAVLTRV